MSEYPETPGFTRTVRVGRDLGHRLVARGTLSLRFAHRRVPDCRRCGIYVGAICETPAGVRAVINVNCLDNRAAFIQQPVPVDHDGETAEDRLARRAANWTPAVIHR